MAEPYGASMVQVLSNQAKGQLVVNGYGRCITAHNIAGKLRVGGDVPEHLLESNLSLG